MIDNRKIMAVTNRHLCEIPFTEQIRRVCSGEGFPRPDGMILREKDLPEDEYEKLAAEVLTICRQYDMPLILHTYPDAARRLGIRQIHLPLWKLREIGGQADTLTALHLDFDVIGSSIHAPAEALEAQSLGATYVTAGHIYLTDCKKGLPARGLSFLENVCSTVQIPVYGIGGIGFDEAQHREVGACGAAGVCIMSGYFQCSK